MRDGSNHLKWFCSEAPTFPSATRRFRELPEWKWNMRPWKMSFLSITGNFSTSMIIERKGKWHIGFDLFLLLIFDI